jgi:regulator of sirC expression with transglutaminase-like and TPR domain
MNKTKREILTDAANHREQEVLMHQINIDNYILAIDEINNFHSDNAGLQEFAIRLKDLLDSSILEQSKEIILLKVINKQLEE